MLDLTLGQLVMAWIVLFALSAPVAIGYITVKKKLTMTRFTRFLGILIIGIFSSFIPYGPIGLLFGFPAVITGSILTSLFLDKEGS